MATLNLSYRPPGPIAGAAYRKRGRFIALNGPIGSGKTTADFTHHIAVAQEVPPSLIDGISYYALATVMKDYPRLHGTAIPSWFNVIPRDVGKFDGADNRPAHHHVRFKVKRGAEVRTIYFDHYFLAIGDQSADEALRGRQYTAFNFPEGDQLSKTVFENANGRVNRHPGKIHCAAPGGGMTADFNAPEFGNFMHEWMADLTPGVDLFIQPAGLIEVSPGRYVPNPDAENLHNLQVDKNADPSEDPLGPGNYYMVAAKNADEDYIQRMLMNRPGFSKAGKPVFKQFSMVDNVALAELEPEDVPIIGGLDAGGSPAVSLRQVMPYGQRRVIDTLKTEAGTGAERFGEQLNDTLARYRGLRIVICYDPSATAGRDKKTGDGDFISRLRKVCKVALRPAPTNNIQPRLNAVKMWLGKKIDPRTPHFIICPVRGKPLIRAYAGGYYYVRQLVAHTHDVDWAELPAKNEHSHVADADQYAALGDGSYAAFLGRDEEPNAVRDLMGGNRSDSVSVFGPAGGGRRPRRLEHADREESTEIVLD